MKFAVVLVLLVASAAAQDAGTGGSEIGGMITDQLKEFLPVIKEVAKGLFQSVIGKLMAGLNPNYMDEIIAGRSVRITFPDDNTAVILDRSTNVKVSGTGDDKEAAVEDGSAKFIVKLLELGVLTPHNLNLPFTEAPTTAPCVNKHTVDYCQKMKDRGYCVEGHHFAAFMTDNCYKMCSGC